MSYSSLFSSDLRWNVELNTNQIERQMKIQCNIVPDYQNESSLLQSMGALQILQLHTPDKKKKPFEKS